MREKLYSPWQSKIKLRHIKVPSFGKLYSLCQVNQACKEEKQRRNLPPSNFARLCENAKGAPAAEQRARLKKMNLASCANSRKPCELKKVILQPCKISQAMRTEKIEFRKLCEISQALQNK